MASEKADGTTTKVEDTIKTLPGKWIQISSFAFFQIPELFFCYIYVYCENFEINIV